MFNIDTVSKIHLELSSYCNAKCPGCPRNFYGQKFNGGYIERNLTLADIKSIFKDNFLQQITNLRINGNFGDFVMNPHSIDIIKWMKSENPDIVINISTNASAQKVEFWEELGTLGVIVSFDIDGIFGTHEIYRRGTSFNTVLKNAKAYIKAGGEAHCQFIQFKHNATQEHKLKLFLLRIGFTEFKAIKNTRGHLPVFNEDGKVCDIDGTDDSPLNFTTVEELQQFKQENVILLEDITNGKECKQIDCEAQRRKEIYISAQGDVYPCCYLGFEPKTYESGYHSAANNQFKHMVANNNAIENSLVDCIKWFDDVANTWQHSSFDDGMLVICQDSCGKP